MQFGSHSLGFFEINFGLAKSGSLITQVINCQLMPFWELKHRKFWLYFATATMTSLMWIPFVEYPENRGQAYWYFSIWARPGIGVFWYLSTGECIWISVFEQGQMYSYFGTITQAQVFVSVFKGKIPWECSIPAIIRLMRIHTFDYEYIAAGALLWRDGYGAG